MTNFYSYNKINSTISEKLVNEINKVDKWYIFEKIHGANFSFCYSMSNNEIKLARRTGYLEPGEKFYSYEVILEETLPKIHNIINQVKEKSLSSLQTIIIYGELFGGYFPNTKSKYSAIQKGVYYSPDIHFSAFDIFIVESDGSEYYLDISSSLEIFKNSGIMYCEPIAILNSFEQVQNYPIGFNSFIPEKLGLQLELETNKAEGIVAKSINTEPKGKRIVIKRKIPEFEETIKTQSKNNKTNIQIISNGFINNIKDKVYPMITLNRLNNASSKIGEFTENKWKIYGLMVEDIIEELDLDIEDKDIIKSIRKWIFDEIKKMFD